MCRSEFFWCPLSKKVFRPVSSKIRSTTSALHDWVLNQNFWWIKNLFSKHLWWMWWELRRRSWFYWITWFPIYSLSFKLWLWMEYSSTYKPFHRSKYHFLNSQNDRYQIRPLPKMAFAEKRNLGNGITGNGTYQEWQFPNIAVTRNDHFQTR